VPELVDVFSNQLVFTGQGWFVFHNDVQNATELVDHFLPCVAKHHWPQNAWSQSTFCTQSTPDASMLIFEVVEAAFL